MSKKKHILVAIDFNNVSDHLLEYVSKDVHKEDHITLLYILNQGYMGVNLATGVLPFDKESQRLRVLTDQYFSDFENVENQIGFDPNDAGDGIVRFAKRNNVDAIYIGSRDNHNLMDRLLGSTSLRVVTHAPCDVMVIPFNTEYRPAKKMVLAAGEGVSEVLTPERLKRWSGRHILFVNVSKDGKDFEDEKKKLLTKLFEDNNVGFSFGIQSVASQNTVKSILSFAHNEGADRILLRKSDQSLISTLFLSSTTKEIIEKSVLPLIFLTKQS